MCGRLSRKQPQPISVRSTNTRLISISGYNDTQANFATSIPRRKLENRVKASELEFDEVRDESRRTKMIIFINSHDNQ